MIATVPPATMVLSSKVRSVESAASPAEPWIIPVAIVPGVVTAPAQKQPATPPVVALVSEVMAAAVGNLVGDALFDSIDFSVVNF